MFIVASSIFCKQITSLLAHQEECYGHVGVSRIGFRQIVYVYVGTRDTFFPGTT